MKTFIIIPSRLAATRLPGKPLLKINNLSIISHVFRKAQEANFFSSLILFALAKSYEKKVANAYA